MSDSNNTQTASGGIGLGGFVFLIFLFLKLAGIGAVATWSWLWVTAPLWIPLAFLAAIVLIVVTIGVIKAAVDGVAARRKLTSMYMD